LGPTEHLPNVKVARNQAKMLRARPEEAGIGKDCGGIGRENSDDGRRALALRS